jgi:PKD repeat protein
VSDSTISLGQSVTFTDASTGDIASWSWEFERGVPETFSGQYPPPVFYNIMGAYDVTLTVRNVAGKSVKYKPAFIQVGPAGVKNPGFSAGFSLSPNPCRDGMFRVYPGYPGENEIIVTSCQGADIAKKTTDTSGVAFYLPNLEKGLYLIRVKNIQTGIVQIHKLIIQ